MAKPWVFEAKLDFFPERGLHGEWVVVVYKKKGNNITVVDLGTEVSIVEAEKFGATSVLFWSNQSTVPPMDMHDRANLFTYFYVLSKKFGVIAFEDQQ